MKYTASLLVEGIVQGVGFRPTVYRIAKALNLNGYVRNMGNIVEIIIQGKQETIDQFIQDLQTKKPIRSTINNIEADIQPVDENTKIYDDFSIKESSDAISGTSVIPPDMSICDECLDEIYNNTDRHYQYPFTACTNCGPRFTLIRDVPYDRKNTTMDEFPLCEDCLKEYYNPENRRYHAEATCCPECGPQVFLANNNGIIKCDNPIEKTSQLIDSGKILAIKGIGGTHLVCKTTTDDAVNTLRKRLGRYTQPFACMTPDIKTARKFVKISSDEEEMLTSTAKPIVVLDKTDDYILSDSISPNLHNQGVMLPYTGLHYLLFKYSDEPAFIMTSANLPGNPMLIENNEIIENLDGIADYYLLHDREILNRCDDSVIRFRNQMPGFIRRSRGFTPKPYDFTNIDTTHNILAMGPELDVTFAVLKNGKCYPSQHIGNTSKIKTIDFMKDAIKHMLHLTKTEHLDYIVCDMHPEFNTTKLAKQISLKYDIPLIFIQHHHAHAASLMVEHNLDKAIVITADGVGYGEDTNTWGGEVLYLDNTGKYNNLGGLKLQPMPGGDLSTKYPIRMAMGILSTIMDHEELRTFMKENYSDYFKYNEKEVDMTLKQLENNFNTAKTSSMGRILDSISVLLKISKSRGYEGECSMKLESSALKAKGHIKLDVPINTVDERMIIDTSQVLYDIVELIRNGEDSSEIAYAAQRDIIKAMCSIAIENAKIHNIDTIGVTGGVFYNEHISQVAKKTIKDAGFKFVQNNTTCSGDGSVSVGECAVGAWKINNKN